MEKLLIINRVFEVLMGGEQFQMVSADDLTKVAFYCILKLGEKHGAYLLLEADYIKAFVHESLEIKDVFYQFTSIDGAIATLSDGYEQLFSSVRETDGGSKRKATDFSSNSR
mmetsp:Transcript_23959/g.18283  ORF Transcript_23959/g.18283 Transcript_23959/m.18283 type:complete len:112 (+) Transcript_23959:874-1209(+)